MSDKSRALYTEVATITEETDEVVIPNGETWEIQEFSGFANESRDAHVCLIWDYGEGKTNEIVALSHGTLKGKIIGRQLVGDGIKILAICLRNDELSGTERLGAEYLARKID